jgi:hypothetical protein
MVWAFPCRFLGDLQGSVVGAGLDHGERLEYVGLHRHPHNRSRFGNGSQYKGGEDMDREVRALPNGTIGIYHRGPLVWHRDVRKSCEDCNSLRSDQC